MSVVIGEVAYFLAHVPDFVRYGAKPLLDIQDNGNLLEKIKGHLRRYDEAVHYAPNQVFIGNMEPNDLYTIPKPWYGHPVENAQRNGPFGEIMPEDEFYGWMKIADDFALMWLFPDFVDEIRDKLAAHPFIKAHHIKKLGGGKDPEKINEILENGHAAPLYFNGRLVGSMRRDHDKDDTLKPYVFMENLMAKASGAVVMHHLLKRAGLGPEEVDFVLDCTETAIGDRYNRGGGAMSKAMAEMCGCTNATGNDTRAFCCAPNHAMITAAGLVETGIYNNVVVAGGGMSNLLGTKYAAHLKHDMPILEDVVGGIAFLITKDDGVNPIIRLDSVGKHDIRAGSNQQQLMTSLVLKPLEKIGLKMTDIDKYATELHNPEITLPAGSGDAPLINYQLIASLAVLNGEIEKREINDFVRQRGMPGYCPTQGHIPCAVPYLGHAIKKMKKGAMERAMFLAKGSLFLGRMCQLADGISFLLEANCDN
jgi:hypothetical protein